MTNLHCMQSSDWEWEWSPLLGLLSSLYPEVKHLQIRQHWPHKGRSNAAEPDDYESLPESAARCQTCYPGQ